MGLAVTDMQRANCTSSDARYQVVGEGRGNDPAGPCQKYPGATAITFTSGGAFRNICTINR